MKQVKGDLNKIVHSVSDASWGHEELLVDHKKIEMTCKATLSKTLGKNS